MAHPLLWIVEAISLGLAVILCIPAALLLLQVLASGLRSSRAAESPEGPPPGVTVLMPAHDEAGGIVHALGSITRQLRPGIRILVVADNCSDDTARLAREAGAEVIERFDSTRRGKGYALDFGVRHLETAPPEVVIVIDADCSVGPGALERLAGQCLQLGRPTQALYLMQAPREASLKVRMAQFAQVLKNKLRPLGYQRLGLPCQLMGTGMAFPWPIIRDAHLASGAIVEDLKLGIDLAVAGTPARFCPEASVLSELPTSAVGMQTQRTRWEHGHLAALWAYGPALVWRATTTANAGLVAVALDLMVPPLAFLVSLIAGAIAWGAALWLLGGWAAPLAAAGIAALLVGTAVILAWHREGRGIVSGSELLRAPLYVLSKLPIYLKLIRKPETEWVRTARDDQVK